MDEKIEEMAKLIKPILVSSYVVDRGDDEVKQQAIKEVKKQQTRNANTLYSAGYRKESDTAREILKWLVWNKHLFNRTNEIGFEKPRTSYLIMSDEIEELAEKYGVDLGE